MIIPAIIPNSLRDIESQVFLVKDYVSRVQVDVVDGLFANSITWPYVNGGDFDGIVSGVKRLPFHSEVEYEIHLMVQDPASKIDEWIAAGANAIIAHASMLQSPHLTSKKIKDAGIEFGIAVTPIEYQIIDDTIFELADFIQVMGSNKIGHHGVKLSEEAVDIIKALSKNFKRPISVDIGVNSNTIGKLRNAGATRFVSGSAIFKSNSTKDAINSLEE